jgi:hypothetical protein
MIFRCFKRAKYELYPDTEYTSDKTKSFSDLMSWAYTFNCNRHSKIITQHQIRKRVLKHLDYLTEANIKFTKSEFGLKRIDRYEYLRSPHFKRSWGKMKELTIDYLEKCLTCTPELISAIKQDINRLQP